MFLKLFLCVFLSKCYKNNFPLNPPVTQQQCHPSKSFEDSGLRKIVFSLGCTAKHIKQASIVCGGEKTILWQSLGWIQPGFSLDLTQFT